MASSPQRPSSPHLGNVAVLRCVAPTMERLVDHAAYDVAGYAVEDAQHHGNTVDAADRVAFLAGHVLSGVI